MCYFFQMTFNQFIQSCVKKYVFWSWCFVPITRVFFSEPLYTWIHWFFLGFFPKRVSMCCVKYLCILMHFYFLPTTSPPLPLPVFIYGYFVEYHTANSKLFRLVIKKLKCFYIKKIFLPDDKPAPWVLGDERTDWKLARLG